MDPLWILLLGIIVVVGGILAIRLHPFLALLLGASTGCSSREESTARLYSEHCASCHGDDGRGDPRRTALEPQLDLTASELVTSGSRGAVYRAISSGYGAMPGFAHRLAHPELDDLTSFVMAMAPERPGPAE